MGHLRGVSDPQKKPIRGVLLTLLKIITGRGQHPPLGKMTRSQQIGYLVFTKHLILLFLFCIFVDRASQWNRTSTLKKRKPLVRLNANLDSKNTKIGAEFVDTFCRCINVTFSRKILDVLFWLYAFYKCKHRRFTINWKKMPLIQITISQIFIGETIGFGDSRIAAEEHGMFH